MVSDMENELEELTALTVTPEKPASSPKAYLLVYYIQLVTSLRFYFRSGSKNQFSLDTIFTKKGQQYLTPILQVSHF